MSLLLNIQFEKAIRLLSKYMPTADEATRKPVLFHGLRVGTYLYEHNYSQDIVLAGVLHDVLEDTKITEEELRTEFGDNVTRLIRASTKDDSVSKEEKTEELIRRCIDNGQDALIVKSADILDSFKWYDSQNNKSEIEYCMKNANAIFTYKPDNFTGPIFEELKSWQIKFSTTSQAHEKGRTDMLKITKRTLQGKEVKSSCHVSGHPNVLAREG
jgi:GTP pyrophosphokinase